MGPLLSLIGLVAHLQLKHTAVSSAASKALLKHPIKIALNCAYGEGAMCQEHHQAFCPFAINKHGVKRIHARALLKVIRNDSEDLRILNTKSLSYRK